MLKPIRKKSVAEAAFEQLRQQIIDGDLEPGEALPAERQLSELLQVNRGAVREALKRLEQARLVSIQHGGATRVLDYMQTAGLDLLACLLLQTDGGIDKRVARSVMEMRSALGPDIARRAAERGTDNQDLIDDLNALAEEIAEQEGSSAGLEARSRLNLEFWDLLIEASDNIAYQLAYNSIRQTYEELREMMTSVLADELNDNQAHFELAKAVANGDGERAASVARELVKQGERTVVSLLDELTS